MTTTSCTCCDMPRARASRRRAAAESVNALWSSYLCARSTSSSHAVLVRFSCTPHHLHPPCRQYRLSYCPRVSQPHSPASFNSHHDLYSQLLPAFNHNLSLSPFVVSAPLQLPPRPCQSAQHMIPLSLPLSPFSSPPRQLLRASTVDGPTVAPFASSNCDVAPPAADPSSSTKHHLLEARFLAGLQGLTTTPSAPSPIPDVVSAHEASRALLSVLPCIMSGTA